MNNHHLEGIEALEALANENCLLDTRVLRIEISDRDFVIAVSIDIKMRPKSDFELVRLEFSGVTEYGFYSTDRHHNYVARYKLQRMENGLFYISLDPFDESPNESRDDQDFLYSKSVKLVVLR